ncbi:CD3324 family protein [Cellulosilyticum sp. WCF-2]|uniref:CD3324 family protein n=1 Tax=Cellulosilyticum sp. WCF-2 TaxID=2497860 RepID=UPI000F8C61AE|nr:CD3324 family protein [Cellulosilyticum sp. WCF-2]QEH70400.1 hypothetical protein EKH84_19160 [Cellulosilyticum sp. WCF-2]
MSYKKAEAVLPNELLEMIQEYIDGEYLYIPKKEENRKIWGTNTSIRQELQLRNQQIYADYKKGISPQKLGGKYYLSLKSIQRILLQERKKNV